MTNCNDGIVIYDNSFPDMYDPPYYDGYNSIHDNTIDISLNYVSIATSSNLDALGDYWNGGNPANAHFQTAADSKIYTDMYLTTDPWAGVSLPSTKGGSKTTDRLVTEAAPTATTTLERPGNPISPPDSRIADSLSEGIRYRAQGSYRKAAGFFRSWLGRHPGDQRAYEELYNCADSSTTPGIMDFFQHLPKQATEKQHLLLGYLYLKTGKISEAQKVNNKVIQANPNNRAAQEARINNGYIALYNDHDLNAAVKTYTNILNSPEFADSLDVNMLRNDIMTYARLHRKHISVLPKLSQALSGAKIDKPSPNKPTTTILESNYPNPFNPTTTIRYQLAKNSQVRLTVWNILGRKVATLVNANEQAGVYHVTFNALHLSSGIYFYRLRAGDKVMVNKMLLLK